MARSGFNIVCVDRQEGTYVVDSLTGHVGGQIPLGVGSASQAILAFLPDAEAQAVIDTNESRYAAFNRLSADEVRSEIAATRARGYALDQGRLVSGISAIAAPIAVKGRDVVAALGDQHDVDAIADRSHLRGGGPVEGRGGTRGRPVEPARIHGPPAYGPFTAST